jgi:peroxiredoxin
MPIRPPMWVRREMSLREELEALMRTRPAVYRDMIGALATRLRETALEGVLQAGAAMPDFVLPSVDGSLVFAGDLLAKGPVVVAFFRGGWCPFCKATLAALNAVVADIEAAGASLIGIIPDTGDLALATARGLGLRFPVLCDVDGATAMAFGVLHRMPDALRAFMVQAGVDLAQWHGDPHWLLPMPATFVADRDGTLRFAYASGGITDPMEPDAIVAMVRSMVGVASTR